MSGISQQGPDPFTDIFDQVIPVPLLQLVDPYRLKTLGHASISHMGMLVLLDGGHPTI
jgi:hypothetical protein